MLPGDGGGDLEPEHVDARRRGRRRSAETSGTTAAGARAQATQADAEEAAEQDEVREEREQPDVRRHPADERDFQEQDQKRGENRASQADDCMIRTPESSGRHPESSITSTPGVFARSHLMRVPITLAVLLAGASLLSAFTPQSNPYPRPLEHDRRCPGH